jgi:hypothetical protein
MKALLKYAVTASLAGALALATMSPSEARGGRNAAVIGGFAAGALVGAAVAGSAYNNGYYGPAYGYGYAPGYYAEPGYAYEPAPVYVEPAPTYYYSGRSYYNRGDFNCPASPASMNSGAAC